MNKKIITITLVALSTMIITLLGCSGSSSSSSAASTDKSVSGTISSAVAVIAEAGDSSNSSTGSSTKVAINDSSSRMNQKKGFKGFLYNMIDTIAGGKDVYAASLFPVCSGGGSISLATIYGTWTTTGQTEFCRELTVSSCTNSNSNYTASGTTMFLYTNLSNTGNSIITKIQTNSELWVAFKNRELTHTSGAITSVVGTGALKSDTDITGETNATFTNVPFAHQIIYSSITGTTCTYNLNVQESRTKTLDGATISDHDIITPSPLSITTTSSTRTINSGTLKVEHVLADFTCTIDYTTPVVYTIGNPIPQSGMITVTITKTSTSAVTGVSTITFNGTTSPTVALTSGTSIGTVALDL